MFSWHLWRRKPWKGNRPFELFRNWARLPVWRFWISWPLCLLYQVKHVTVFRRASHSLVYYTVVIIVPGACVCTCVWEWEARAAKTSKFIIYLYVFYPVFVFLAMFWLSVHSVSKGTKYRKDPFSSLDLNVLFLLILSDCRRRRNRK